MELQKKRITIDGWVNNICKKKHSNLIRKPVQTISHLNYYGAPAYLVDVCIEEKMGETTRMPTIRNKSIAISFVSGKSKSPWKTRQSGFINRLWKNMARESHRSAIIKKYEQMNKLEAEKGRLESQSIRLECQIQDAVQANKQKSRRIRTNIVKYFKALAK